MKKYIDKLINERTPHERRLVAMQVAGVVTAFIFVVWASTLSLRLAESPNAAQNVNSAAATLIAVGASTTTGY